MRSRIDFKALNESMIELDRSILESTIVNKNGSTLLAHSTRRGYARKISFDEEAAKFTGPWIATLIDVARQSEEILGKTEYVAVGRQRYKGLIIPLDDLDAILRVALQKEIEPARIIKKIQAHLKKNYTSSR